MNEVVFPGSFDPITNGHVDIIKRALTLFKKIVIAVGINSNKKYMFKLEDRIHFINDTFKNEKKIEVKSYDGLTVEFCKKNNIKVILRGLRNPDDFEFENNKLPKFDLGRPEFRTLLYNVLNFEFCGSENCQKMM